MKEEEGEAVEKEKGKGKEEFPLFLVLPLDFIVARIPLQSKFSKNLLHIISRSEDHGC